jgi:hypothetical protein
MTSKFGWLQAPATKKFFCLQLVPQTPQPSELTISSSAPASERTADDKYNSNSFRIARENEAARAADAAREVIGAVYGERLK